MITSYDYTTESFKEILRTDKEFEEGLLKIRPINEEQTKYMIFIGNKAATPYRFESIGDAQHFIDKKPYSIMFALIAAMIDANNNINNNIKEPSKG